MNSLSFWDPGTQAALVQPVTEAVPSLLGHSVISGLAPVGHVSSLDN